MTSHGLKTAQCGPRHLPYTSFYAVTPDRHPQLQWDEICCLFLQRRAAVAGLLGPHRYSEIHLGPPTRVDWSRMGTWPNLSQGGSSQDFTFRRPRQFLSESLVTEAVKQEAQKLCGSTFIIRVGLQQEDSTATHSTAALRAVTFPHLTFPRNECDLASLICESRVKASIQGWRHGCETWASAQGLGFRQAALGLMLCCCHFEILSNFSLKVPAFSSCIRPQKLLSLVLQIHLYSVRGGNWQRDNINNSFKVTELGRAHFQSIGV